MTILLVESSEESQKYFFTLGDSMKVVTSSYDLFDYVSRDPSEQLIVIGPNIKIDTVRNIAEHYRTTRTSLGIILIRHRLDVAVMSEALKNGIREVVSDDDANSLAAACKRSIALSSNLTELGSNNLYGSKKGKVFVVFSAKGGCGKTTVSVNLAYAIAQKSKGKVALIDLDLQFGDVAVALQIDSKKTISDAISMQSNLDVIGLKSLMVNQLTNLDILLAPTNPTDVEFISVELVDKILMNLKESYDYIVVDTPPAFTDVILKVFDQADKCFLLTTLDMPAIKNLKIVISTLEALNVNKSRLTFILNKSNINTGIQPNEVEEMLGETFEILVPFSEEIPISTNRGIPLVVEKPNHPVSKSILKLASQTLIEFQEDVNSNKGKIKRGWSLK